MTRRTAQSISRIWSSRPTKCTAQGGAGSKRSMLGCDPGAGQERAIMRGPNARLRGRIPASGARRRAEEGPLWGSDPADAHGIGFDTTRSRSAPRSHPASGSLLRVAPIPATRFGAPPILAATLRAGTSFGLSPPALGERSFGAETGWGVPQLPQPGARAPFPQTGLRQTSHGAPLSLPLPIFAILAAGSFASRAKIVPAHHAFHCVTGSNRLGRVRRCGFGQARFRPRSKKPQG